MKKVSKKGFTLSEVLLTFVIVGVLYVFVIPSVKNLMPDKYQTLYKKNYQSMMSAIRYSIMDKSLPVSQSPMFWANPDSDISKNPSGLPPVNPQEFCIDISKSFSTVGTVDCSIEGTAATPNFVTVNGTSWWGLGGTFQFTAPPTTNPKETRDIFVDLDGKNGKNMLGVDQFRMRIRYDGKITTDPAWTKENAYLTKKK